MTGLFHQLLFTLRFFTRLPIPGENQHEGDLASAAIAFPLAGLCIGLATALIWIGAAALLPALPAAGLTIAAGMLITGALHEDGFSDCADGLGGGHTKERALEIMRDSRIGAYGAAALIMTIGLRWTALGEQNPWNGFAALLIAHMASRASIVIALARAHYARDEGLGSAVSSGVASRTLILVLSAAALLAFIFGQFSGLLSVVVAFALGWLFMKYLVHRLGGYTGDGLGAIQQISEITILLLLAGLWS